MSLEEAVDLKEKKFYGDSILDDKISEEAIKAAKKEIEELRKGYTFDLDKALDTYDPTFPRYTISKDALEFFAWMRLVAGEDFEFSTPIAHYFMVDMLLGNITDPMMFPYSAEVCSTIDIDTLRVGVMASRGMAKSTVILSFFGVYSAMKGELPNGIGKVYFYIILAASSRGGARVNALAVKAMCEDSEFLKEYFEDMRFTETESEFIRKGPGPRKDRSFLIRYQGIATGIRGSRYGERRPDAIFFDDAILNTAAAYSKVMGENLDEVIHSDATNALKGGGKGRVILCFTPFHYGDVNTKALLNGAFTPVVIPVAKDFNAEGNVTADNIVSSWPAMHPEDSIAKLCNSSKKSKKLGAFLQERMLRLTSGADRLVPDDCIQFCDMTPIVDNIGSYNVYITTDYTTTSGEGSDYSGIATWAVSSNEDWFLLNLTLRKRSMVEQYYETLNEAAKWRRKGKYVEIGVEVDGNQGAHIHSLESEMMKRGDFYTFARAKDDPYSDRKGIISKNAQASKKHERFRIASQAFLQKKLWFPEHIRYTPDMEEFVLQIKGATHENFTRADDGPDLVTMALVSIEVVYPSTTDFSTSTYREGSDDYMWHRYGKADDDNITDSTIF